MFIAIVGTRCSGKTTVQDYLVHHKGFTLVSVGVGPGAHDHAQAERASSPKNPQARPDRDDGHPGGMDISEQSSGRRPEEHHQMATKNARSSSLHSSDTIAIIRFHPEGLRFATAAALLDHITQNWRADFVTSDLTDIKILDRFSKRPFFLLISVDAPLMARYRRYNRHANGISSLEEFIVGNDRHVYGQTIEETDNLHHGVQHSSNSLHSLKHLVNLHIVNSFEAVSAFQTHLDTLNLVDPNRLRPDWDTYFMTLASLASQRSNCMKRRVGAILVRDHRIVATGYNGTPRGVTNCNEGGCPRCNSGQEALDECLCLHAEENALLEAGRERVGAGAVLYCNTCPCLKCTIKIIQTGVKEVIYNLSYKVDDASARLFEEAGVELRRHAPPP
ncbi:hypothetical protein NEOLEDRAFT_44111 [Neolentinus lepideus HHB14362 ss-1]|uniref:Deoxycytidylate deaminase n=1 Tax=Neolentinus lepideus HHB14362 ss-1 TaxID=1314782 RepID=A0A165WA52_9AGAM|nr:hypothetical protein NEOLEDRAFT_44111 [Neolentinus lepideus HHB14362 ss-1]